MLLLPLQLQQIRLLGRIGTEEPGGVWRLSTLVVNEDIRQKLRLCYGHSCASVYTYFVPGMNVPGMLLYICVFAQRASVSGNA